MPKAFTPAEKKKISTQLQKAGLERFRQNGIRAARVDDICRDVGIAKGSFYAFYSSKEDLFMAMADERDLKHKADMIEMLESAEGSPREILEQFFDFMLERIQTDPVLRIVRDTGELAHLARKVPPERLIENTRRDREFMIEVANIFQNRLGIEHADSQTLEGLLTLILSVALQDEHLLATDTYDQTFDLLRDLYLSRLMKGPFND